MRIIIEPRELTDLVKQLTAKSDRPATEVAALRAEADALREEMRSRENMLKDLERAITRTRSHAQAEEVIQAVTKDVEELVSFVRRNYTITQGGNVSGNPLLVERVLAIAKRLGVEDTWEE